MLSGSGLGPRRVAAAPQEAPRARSAARPEAPKLLAGKFSLVDDDTGYWDTPLRRYVSRHEMLLNFRQKVCPFSAVSAPIFASKYAFVAFFKID